MLEKIKQSANYIKACINGNPKYAVVLGSGLGGFTSQLEILREIPYAEIPGFPTTTVAGHSGKLLHARQNGIQLLIMQGRFHFYEGHKMEVVTYPIRVFKELGIEQILLSNASGGMNPDFEIGDLMIISDHINLMPNPLLGPHDDRFGARFPDMSEAYDEGLIAKAEEISKANSIKIHKGVYVGVTGPTYETPAEYKFFRIIGGDVVGMSTVPEVIVARQMGMKCFAISVVTDLGVPGKIEYMTHDIVQKAAAAAEPKMATIIKGLIQ